MSASSEYLAALTDLSAQKANAQANAVRARGQIVGNTLASLGQILPQIQQARQQDRQQASLDAERQSIARQRDLQGQVLQRQLDTPPDQTEAQKRALDIATLKTEHLGRLLVGANQENWGARRPLLVAIGGPEADAEFPETYPGDQVRDAHIAQSQTVKDQLEAAQKAIDAAKPKPKPDYTIGNQRFGGDSNEVVATAAVTPPKLTYGTPQPQMVNGKRVLTRAGSDGQMYDMRLQPIPGEQIAPEPKTPPSGSGPSSEETTNVKDAVQGMIDGLVPPILPGRASKDYIALIAEAKRRGYDLAQAATDWAATQKHIATMNGSQQLRLNQSINALPELLDSVDALATQWKGGRFPILNKANLSAAKNGVYGDAVASVARQLESQIADVTADLGNVYMGGNSPTDQALQLAGKSLAGDWSEKVLRDMVKLARGNVKIRRNSINNTGVAGASDDNQYAPKQDVAPPTGRYNPATGKVE